MLYNVKYKKFAKNYSFPFFIDLQIHQKFITNILS